MFSFLLISCKNEEEVYHNVRFYLNDNLIYQDKVLDGETVNEYNEVDVDYWLYNNEEFNFNNKIYEDIDLYGVNINKYQVSFITDVHDGDKTYFNKQSFTGIKEGTTINPIDEMKINNKLFLGWFKDNKKFDFDSPIYKDITLYAKYVNETNNVTLMYNGEVFKNYQVKYGETIKIKETIEEELKEFIGWYYNDNYLFDDNTKVYEDIILKPKFKNINNQNNNNFDIFYLNDTHGAVLKKDNELGLSYIGNYINNKKDDNSIFITGGDTLQGQLISNANKGEIIIEILNELNLDAFVIGNHEFDWGLEEVIKYFDPSYSGVKANFPLLGANVVLKSTNERPEFIDSHKIIERNGNKIGIIGVIGDGLESSIAAQRVKDYKFTDAFSAVNKIVKEIENEVDFIIVANHGNDSYFNEQVGSLNKVRAIFNGHSHQAYTGLINQKIPYMQSGRYSERIGHMNIEFDNDFNITKSQANNIKTDDLLNSPDENIEQIINRYYENLKHLYEEELIKSRNYMSQTDLANYIAKVMREVTGAVAGFQNSGGTRSTFNKNQMITAADIFQVFPFDNQIIYTEIKGKALKRMLNDSYFIINSDINEYDIRDNELYRVATNDYIYYHNLNQYAFKNTNPIVYGDMYETLYEVILKLKELDYEYFDINSPIHI